MATITLHSDSGAQENKSLLGWGAIWWGGWGEKGESPGPGSMGSDPTQAMAHLWCDEGPPKGPAQRLTWAHLTFRLGAGLICEEGVGWQKAKQRCGEKWSEPLCFADRANRISLSMGCVCH